MFCRAGRGGTSGAEKKGIGTPATRAVVIEELVAHKYVKREGKKVIATEDGLSLIHILAMIQKLLHVKVQEIKITVIAIYIHILLQEN